MGAKEVPVPLRLEFLGIPQVRRDTDIVRFDTRKATALLAVLAVTGRTFGRDALAALLWPDLDRSRARATLRRTLSTAGAVGPALVVAADRVGLDMRDVECDVIEFRRLAESNEVGDWRRAVKLPAERFLDGFSLRDSTPFDEWLWSTADDLRGDLARTLGRLVADAVSRRDWPEALACAHRRVQVEPLSEPAHADLIRISGWAGDRPAALSAYRRLVRLLDRELGVPPLPETLALSEDIRAGRLVPPPALPAASVSSVSAGGAPPDAPVLVGRADEIAQLRACWSTIASAGRLVGIVGESGFGKSLLLSAIADDVGGTVIHVAGRAAEKTLAYAAATDLVRAMLAVEPDLARDPGSTAAPLATFSADAGGASPRGIRTPGDLQRIHEAARSALARLARARPVLLTVDDAEQLDGPSAMMLGYLARRLPAGVLVITTWTPDSRRGPLAEAIFESGELILLPPFGVAEIGEIAGDLDPEAALRATRGIPMLVRELATAPSGADTEAVREIVEARFARASEIARQVVTAAVVIGTAAAPDLLRGVSGRDETETVDAIEEAVARRLLVELRAGYDVPHDLVRNAALSGLSLARRRLLHARTAEALARRHARDPLATPAGAIARHFAEAGREDEAAAWFVRAAEASIRLSADEEAILQLRDAMALGRAGPDIQTAVGSALMRLGRYEEALVSLEQAAATAETDAARLSEIEHRLALVHDRLGDWALAQAHLEAARELADGEERRARVLADLALVQHRRGLAAAARSTALESVAAATAAADRAARAQAENVLGMLALASGDAARAEEILSGAVVRARTVDEDLLIAALNNLSRALAARDAHAQALSTAREALALAEQRGDRHRLAALHSHVADLLHAAGFEEEAMAAMKRSAAAFAAISGSAARPEVWTLIEW